MRVRRRTDSNGWMVDFRIKRKRHRITLPGNMTKKEAEQRAYDLFSSAKRLAERMPETPATLSTATDPVTWARRLLKGARARAQQAGVPCRIDHDYIAGLFEESEARCALTGIPFDFSPRSNGRRRPFVPSIDRIEPERGYVPSNCRLICSAVNIALCDWGEDVLRRIAHALVDRDGELSP